MEKRLIKAVIRRSIQDIGSRDRRRVNKALEYFKGEMCREDCKVVGYAYMGLLDCMVEVAALSEVQRKVLVRRVLEELDGKG